MHDQDLPSLALQQTTFTPETPSSSDWVLGLDIGSNSLGWMLLRDNGSHEGNDAAAIGGVRVFPAATATEKNREFSKTATRRATRSMRRQHNRRARRFRRLSYVLREIGLLPAKPAHIDFLFSPALDPYEIRARGLDAQLHPHEFARALLHLAHRRGFQSNRRARRDEDRKKVAAAIGQLAREIEDKQCRTVGEYLYKFVPAGRERRRGRYLDRAMIRQEFEALWNKQSEFAPDLLTPTAKQQVEEAIFFQRPFLDKERLARLVGFCPFEPGEKRARIGHRLAQRYRIYQETANIRLISIADGAERALTPHELARVRNELDRREKLEFSSAGEALSRFHELLHLDSSIEVNFGRARRTALQGNVAEVRLRKALGAAYWDQLDEDRKNAINELVLEENDEQALVARAQTECAVPEELARKLKDVDLPDRFGRVSLAAIRKLLPHMEAGLSLDEAKKAVGYDDPTRIPPRIYERLPFPPGTVMAERNRDALVEQGLLIPHTTELTNPVVRKALFEVRRLINALVARYGKPKRIVVELARDTRGSIEERNETAKKQREREKENERIRQQLREEHGIPDPSRSDVIKYRLWEECNRTCPYSGKPISFEQLFLTGEVDIEHIIPYSRCLDDSFANKTLCFREWNIRKGDRTPWEAFSQDASYQEMLERVRRFKSELRRQKLNRFLRKEVELDSFVDRQLNDTRYIGRVVRNYLQLLGVPVNVTRGQVTAALRRMWGLDKILAADGCNEKNRNDHRHHAIDAAVIAMTTAKHLHNLARREDFGNRRIPEPFPGFANAIRRAVERIIVSHAPTRRVRGPLHEETAYGYVEPNRYVYRKPLAQLSPNEIEKIRDQRVRELVKARLDEKCPGWREKTTIPKEAFAEPLCLPNRHGDPVPVRKVRLCVSLSNMIGLPKHQPQRFYKPGENHHLEIFEYETPTGLRRDVFVVTLFEAAQRLRRGEPVVSRQHPSRADARFVMSLCKNDMVRVRASDGTGDKYYRVQKFSISAEARPDLWVREHHVAPGRRKSRRDGQLDLWLREHHVASLSDDKLGLRRIRNAKDLCRLEKIDVTILGEISPAHD